MAKRGRGRPAHKKTEELARQVEVMAGFGITQDAIAEILGVSEKTLQNYYSEELRSGGPKANARVAQHLFKLATTDKNPTSAIFWLKCRALWKDHQIIEHVGKDGKDLVPSISVTVRKA